MQEVVGQNPHLQPGLVGLETVSAGLVSAQGIFALFEPIFDLGPAVIDLEHFTGLLDDCGEASGEAPDWQCYGNLMKSVSRSSSPEESVFGLAKAASSRHQKSLNQPM